MGKIYFYILFILTLFLHIVIANKNSNGTDKVEPDESEEKHSCPVCYDALDMIETTIMENNHTIIKENEHDYTQTMIGNTIFLPCNHQLCLQCWLSCVSEEIYECPLYLKHKLQDYLLHPFFEIVLKNIIHKNTYSSRKLSQFFFTSIIYGQLNFAKYLFQHFEKDIDVNFESYDAYTALQGAIFSNKLSNVRKLEAMKFLLEEANANPNFRAENGRTLLHYATYYGIEEVIFYLFEKNLVDIDAQDVDENTPLLLLLLSPHYTSEEPILKLCKFFIEEQQAIVHLPNSNSLTPLLIPFANQ
jgi:ankyrin repeat protein